MLVFGSLLGLVFAKWLDPGFGG